MIIDLFREEKSGHNLEHRICPKGHEIAVVRENMGKAYSDGRINTQGIPEYEAGLYCLKCGRTYGLSKLITPTKETSSEAESPFFIV